ncbi:MAG: helix-turn-helix domain-containing protein [Verrucomicrobiota bacterium]|nr:helix-turn-helix domain-containing protein [Verrucomicrobiota bacterium]
MSAKMGGLFRGKREEMNLSLKEVENATSIRMVYLQAIEEGKAAELLSPVYVLGFIRQYAQFLGLETERLSREFPEAFRLPQEKQDFAYGIGTLEMRANPQGRGRWMPNVGWGALCFLLLVAAWYFGKMVGAF